jgi:hypothetical protein
MSKIALKLQNSEAVVVQTAGVIYSGFVQNGQATIETENDLIDKSVEIAIEIAKRVDRRVRSDREMG